MKMNLHRTSNLSEGSFKNCRSHSAQGLSFRSPFKIPLPPRPWITDVSDESSDEAIVIDDGTIEFGRHRVRSRHRKQKHGTSRPIGIFWDIENCQVPRGCSAIDVVAAIRTKFLVGRREVDFVVVCDVKKESSWRLQELNDAQVSLIHVCSAQKNAADEKLRQYMRRFGELHSAPAALLLISGDINFAADLSDFRHRKNMEVILVHKQNTSSALFACASSHYCYNDLTANLPRNQKSTSQSDVDDSACELEVDNLPLEKTSERLSRRLRRLADNCGGKVIKVTPPTALIRFPTPDHAARALKRMDGEDVFGRKISTRNVRSTSINTVNAYSSDEGYSTAPASQLPSRRVTSQLQSAQQHGPCPPVGVSNSFSLALQSLPQNVNSQPLPPLTYGPPRVVSKPRKIRGAHGSGSLDLSGCSLGNNGDDRCGIIENSQSRAISPWNSSASFSEQSSEGENADCITELTVTNLPPYGAETLREMLTNLFSLYAPVVRVLICGISDGPVGIVAFRSEWDARLVIARLHKRRLENQWAGRRLELSLGRPSPAPSVEILKARLRVLLMDQPNQSMPLLRLRDAYANRHSCALTTSDIARLKDTVIIQDGPGRTVRLIDHTPVSCIEMEESQWKCNIHGVVNTCYEDGGRILSPVYIETSILSKQTRILLDTHGGMLPLLSFVDCYEATFAHIVVDEERGVALELLLRSIPGLTVKDKPSRHITWSTERQETPSPFSQSSDGDSIRERVRPRTAPALEPMLALFEREVVDLLRTAPRCSIPFSKLIPAFHHHFGRQCRVADYGFTKLPDLLAALSHTVVVLGSGSSRIITISSAAQCRRWTSNLVKLLKAQPGRTVYISDIPQLYQETFGRPFISADYGVCTLAELMERVLPQAITIYPDGSISLPRRSPTPEERARTMQFANQAIELLCHTPNLRMDFARFVPAYHAHFGRQLRVAHYGCVKLIELFELISDKVIVKAGSGGERIMKLAVKVARTVMADRLRSISPISLTSLPSIYTVQFGGPPLPDILDARTLDGLVFAAGGCVEDGNFIAPGNAPRWITACLLACAVLSGDRSVTARGSTEEYFIKAFRDRFGTEPMLYGLTCAGVVTCGDGRVQLTVLWRTIWRLAVILASHNRDVEAAELANMYLTRYEMSLPYIELGFECELEFLRCYREMFAEDARQRFSLCIGITVPLSYEMQCTHIDFSVLDTPPGQKGSRVFESPKSNIWCSPPASALPAPSAFLAHDNKRRTRLAAQFNAA